MDIFRKKEDEEIKQQGQCKEILDKKCLIKVNAIEIIFSIFLLWTVQSKDVERSRRRSKKETQLIEVGNSW